MSTQTNRLCLTDALFVVFPAALVVAYWAVNFAS